MQLCFSCGIMGLLLAALLPGASLPAPTRKVTTVRVDPRSGRLVRSTRIGPPAASPAEAPGRREGEGSAQPVSVQEIRELARKVARKHEVEPRLVDSVIQVESAYNPKAVSPKGAQGLMQLIPATARRFGVTDVFRPAENIEGGVRYLKHLLERYDGNERLALAAYNAGEGAVDRYNGIPPYRETREYVERVGKKLSTQRAAAPEPAQQDQEIEQARPYPVIEKIVDADGKEYYRAGQ